MGCFLACLGSSKNSKIRKQRHKRNVGYNAQSTVSLEQSSLGTLVSSVKEVRENKAEEQLGLGSGSGSRKKVTFDTNVKTYEHVLVDESTDFDLPNEEEGGKNSQVELEKGENLAKPRESENSSESSSNSYPPNHRYQNCRESDDEDDDELEYGESDLDDDDDDIEDYVDFSEGDAEEESSKPIDLIRGVGRGRDGDVHPVLKPVENLDQWKAVKSKGSTPLKLQKENLSLEQEEPWLSSLDRSSKDGAFSFSEEVSVDASLSNWLSSRETTPAKKSSTFEAYTPERSVSPGSISMKMSPEDRPILGALTLEDINKFSASSVPRRSPSRSPDDMAIIGTVGTYWNHETTTTTTKDSSACFRALKNI